MLPNRTTLISQPVRQAFFFLFISKSLGIKPFNQLECQFNTVLTRVLATSVTALVLFKTIPRLMDCDAHV